MAAEEPIPGARNVVQVKAQQVVLMHEIPHGEEESAGYEQHRRERRVGERAREHGDVERVLAGEVKRGSKHGGLVRKVPGSIPVWTYSFRRRGPARVFGPVLRAPGTKLRLARRIPRHPG